MPRAGDYRHRVSIITRTSTTDSIGAHTETWAEAFRLWCGIEFEYRPTDHFVEVANAAYAETRVWFRTRATDRLAMTHRLRHDGKDYEILSIQDEAGLNRETKILAREVKS